MMDAAPAASEGQTEATGAAEEEVWKGGPSQWTNIFWWLAGIPGAAVLIYGAVTGSTPLMVVGGVLMLVLLYAAFRALILATTDYRLTSQRLQMRSGILNRQTEEIELYRVRDTALYRSLFERIFGLGTIQIMSADPRTPELKMTGIKGADKVREHFRTYTEKMRKARGVRDIDIS